MNPFGGLCAGPLIRLGRFPSGADRGLCPRIETGRLHSSMMFLEVLASGAVDAARVLFTRRRASELAMWTDLIGLRGEETVGFSEIMGPESHGSHGS